MGKTIKFSKEYIICCTYIDFIEYILIYIDFFFFFFEFPVICQMVLVDRNVYTNITNQPIQYKQDKRKT